MSKSPQIIITIICITFLFLKIRRRFCTDTGNWWYMTSSNNEWDKSFWGSNDVLMFFSSGFHCVEELPIKSNENLWTQLWNKLANLICDSIDIWWKNNQFMTIIIWRYWTRIYMTFYCPSNILIPIAIPFQTSTDIANFNLKIVLFRKGDGTRYQNGWVVMKWVGVCGFAIHWLTWTTIG